MKNYGCQCVKMLNSIKADLRTYLSLYRKAALAGEFWAGLVAGDIAWWIKKNLLYGKKVYSCKCETIQKLQEIFNHQLVQQANGVSRPVIARADFEDLISIIDINLLDLCGEPNKRLGKCPNCGCEVEVLEGEELRCPCQENKCPCCNTTYHLN